jgi:RNase P subunit RPR2
MIKTNDMVSQTFCDYCNKILVTGPMEKYDTPNTVYNIPHICRKCKLQGKNLK